MARVDPRGGLWGHLASAQLAVTLASAAYVFAVNGAIPRSIGNGQSAALIGLAACTFRTAWSYLYVRFVLARSVNRVIVRGGTSRGRRAAVALGESLWAQGVDACLYALIGAECLLSVLPFVATNALSLFASAEAAVAGHPPDRVARRLASRARRHLRRSACAARFGRPASPVSCRSRLLRPPDPGSVPPRGATTMTMTTAVLLAATLIAGEGAVNVNADNIHWLGHATFRIEDGRTQIYVDPWKLPAGAPKADLILVTHAHYDHLSLDDIARIEQPTTTFVAPADVAAKLKGRHVVIAAPGGAYTAAGLRIEAVPAYNIQKDFHKKTANWVGYVVTLSSGVRVYHSGDSDVTPEMKAVKTDIALLPCGGTYTMTASEVAQAANAFKPAILIPMHWGDIVGSKADAETVAREFTAGTTVIRPIERE